MLAVMKTLSHYLQDIGWNFPDNKRNSKKSFCSLKALPDKKSIAKQPPDTKSSWLDVQTPHSTGGPVKLLGLRSCSSNQECQLLGNCCEHKILPSSHSYLLAHFLSAC